MGADIVELRLAKMPSDRDLAVEGGSIPLLRTARIHANLAIALQPLKSSIFDAVKYYV